MTSTNENGQQASTSNSVLEDALSYAAASLAIFPCNPLDKRPLTANGFKDASCDPEQIRDWWTHHPNAMIGIPTGEANGFWVLDADIDPAKNLNGPHELAALIARYGELPPTRTSVTPRGGRHLWFRWHDALTIRNGAGRIAPGIDVRGEGGYVIAPPSLRADGAPYRWDENTGKEWAEAPSWLIALASPQKPSTGRGKTARKSPRRDQVWAQTALDNECNAIAAAPYGQRNQALNDGTFNLFQIIAGDPDLLDEEEVRRRLFAAAEECGLVEDDGAKQCWRTIESGAAAGRLQPRNRPQLQIATGLNLHLAGAGPGPGTGSAAGVAGTSGTTTSTTTASIARRIIQVREGDKSAMLDEVEEELVRYQGFGLYQRGGQLVRTVLIRTADADNRSTLIWRLAPVDSAHLFEVFTRIIEFQKYDRRSRAWIPTDCPAQLPAMYEARQHWQVPTLLGVVHTPQLRADGSLVEAAGYDPATRLQFKFDGEVFPPVPAHPTRDDADAALRLIEDQIATFPFKTNVDRAVVLSLFLTALARRSFDFAPVHAITAPASGTGKSLLVSLASILACGQTAPVIAMGDDKNEFRKLFATQLLSGVPIIAIDNCEQPLTGDLLCQAVSEEQKDIRQFGHLQATVVRAGSLITATGNNLVIGSDMSRRVLTSTIDAGVERPEKRVFKVRIKKLFRQRRGELVSALLTVLRAARLAQAEIERMGLEPLGGFEDWCAWVRDPLIWLDRADPVASVETSYENNVDREVLQTVVFAWRDNVGLGATPSVQGVIDQAGLRGTLGDYRYPTLREALLLVADDRRAPGDLSAKRLGWWLRKVNGKPISNLRLVKFNPSQGNPRWRLETI